MIVSKHGHDLTLSVYLTVLFMCLLSLKQTIGGMVRRSLESYANPRLCLRFALMSRILPTSPVFRREKVLYCLDTNQ